MYPELYKYKFGRDKRQRSIKEIHDIYIRAKDRSTTKQLVSWNIIDEIVKKIPAIESRGSKTHITYFYVNDILYQWEMSYNHEWDSYGISSNRVEFTGTPEEIRTQTIKFITSLDVEFELGEKYNKSKNYNRSLHRRVMHYLIKAITKNLEEMYKNVTLMETPNVIPVNIGNHQYIFHAGDNSSRYYKNFELIGEMVIDPIEM